MDQFLAPELLKALKVFQRDEITGYQIYSWLAKKIKGEKNAAVLKRLADDEMRHYEVWKKYTGTEISPDRIRVIMYFFISRIFGITFGIKLMERGENTARDRYARYLELLPETKTIMDEEDAHEQQLIAMIDEEGLQYAGSIVLGLNDDLVELTGALAGFSLALQQTRLIAMAGLITGIAASFSMAASDYLSKKADDTGKNAGKSAAYTGLAYLFTVALLILPYLIFKNYFVCLGLTLTLAILIILIFNYYISVAKDYNFRRRFTEMAVISLGVSALTFGISFVIKKALGIDL
ncbi:MAG: VIT1/CCC1 transporter family protein [Bacteroidales bacterium]|nr:VIT1/CCC1 transporter family protein [Bacteroidales bacterium]